MHNHSEWIMFVLESYFIWKISIENGQNSQKPTIHWINECQLIETAIYPKNPSNQLTKWITLYEKTNWDEADNVNRYRFRWNETNERDIDISRSFRYIKPIHYESMHWSDHHNHHHNNNCDIIDRSLILCKSKKQIGINVNGIWSKRIRRLCWKRWWL